MRCIRSAAVVIGLVFPVGCASIYGITDLPSDVGEDASDGHADAKHPDAGHHDAAHGDAGHHDAPGPRDASKDATSSHDSGDGAIPPNDAKTDTPIAVKDAAPDSPAAVFTVSPPSVTVVPGASAMVTVTLVAAASADVMVTLSALPSGVTAAPVTIASGSTTGMVTLVAAASAVTGVTSPLVHADGGSRAFTLVVPGASGSFDSTFNQAGAEDFTPAGGSVSSTALSIAVQSDGAILVGGTLGSLASSGWALVRFLPDGTPDATFNANVVDPTKGALLATGGAFGGVAVVQSSGLIVVSGYDTDGGNTNLAVFVLNPDGSRRESFGTAGLYTRGPNVGFHVSSVAAPAVDTSGNIAVAGNTSNGTTMGAYVITLGGVNNASFNQYQTFPAGTGLSAVAYEPSGEIVVGGASPNSGGQFYLARFTAGLTPETFAGTGLLGPTGTSNQYLSAYSMAVDPSGGVFLVGVDDVNDPTPSMTFVDDTGTAPLSMGYANTGPYRMNGSGYLAAASGTTGKAVAVANGYDMAGNDVYAVRITSAGALDTTFANQGVLESDNLSDGRIYDAVAIDAVGRIIIAGNASTGFYIMRVWP